MPLKSYFFVLLVLPVTVPVLSACAAPQKVVSDQAMFTATGRVWTEKEFTPEQVKALKLGCTRNLALVPLVFDSKGHLLSAAEYLEKKVPREEQQILITDYQTYAATLPKLVEQSSQPKERLADLGLKYIWQASSAHPDYRLSWAYDALKAEYKPTSEDSDKPLDLCIEKYKFNLP